LKSCKQDTEINVEKLEDSNGNTDSNTAIPKKNTGSFIKQKKLSAWERVVLSRKNDRPVGGDYIEKMFDDFVEFHGDRYFKDDPAILGGIATFRGFPVTVIAQAKGHNTKENIRRNFGMPSPDGYRKALRLMKQAEKFKRPVICFVDTPGAFCGLEAEERGQGEAIARNLYEMSAIKTPILTIMIGEGGSGGALAMSVADQVWMLENSVYSILSPEGYASILWKDSKRAEEAANVMKMTAYDLHQMGIVEKVFAEPKSYTVETMGTVLNNLKPAIESFLAESISEKIDKLPENRYKRFRNM
jgi:acetyl-CoA carboxylase carboxyl transferase subunit beta